MTRSELLQQLSVPQRFDLAVIGGGATGLGVALEASQRGYKVVLLESHDFAKGTSSRSTKLVHGGVRYLAQGNISLVREALHERSVLLHDAPHLAQPIPFVMPSYRWWETGFYGIGLKLYDFLAGAKGLGRTEFLSAASVKARMPGLKAQGLLGGVQYWDGQFDDARYAVNLARTATQAGALVVNYCGVTQLLHTKGRVSGLLAQDRESGQSFQVNAACVINATGVWVDQVRQLDAQPSGSTLQAIVAPSQGVHLVEVAFILKESARYLARAPKRSDVSSVWVGLRPLVKPHHEEGASTKGLSREHTVSVSPSGLVTVTGGKWTTYRAMAHDVLSQCLTSQLLQASNARAHPAAAFKGATRQSSSPVSLTAPQGMHLYGDEQVAVAALPGADNWLLPGLSEAMVRFAVRHEFARTVEDVLARRSRALFLDARQSAAAAEQVAIVLLSEGCEKPELLEYLSLAHSYTLKSVP